MIDENGTKHLIKALEAGMYGTERQPYAALMDLLVKFGIKSARLDNRPYGGPLKMESLSAILKQVTFDDKQLKSWRAITAKKPCKRCPNNKCKGCPVAKV